ncbi:MAG: DNA repair protein RadA [Deltaproteobacteria bacterium]|nr:DNA repair protein RadA [Deltaproteobacteria bacterium]MBW2254696.1 DNA repair protein RadA [Deltaproteobacteria bacterium]
MAKSRTRHVCQQCGYTAAKWLGRCPECDAWNSFEEEPVYRGSTGPAAELPRPISIDDIAAVPGGEVRVRTGIGELDTVLGGGLVAGSLVLVGGDPGVGKSTLLLLALDRFARKGLTVLYATGEESTRQVQLRAQRLGVSGSPTLLLLAHTDFSHAEAIARDLRPQVMVVDSVQAMQVPDAAGIPGSVSQVRAVAHRAMLLAKQTSTAVFLVGHVTKSGDLAGPKVLEHLVDTVLYFEGDGRSALRILRSVKNRFGPAGELGVFEMVEHGLREVPDASARLLQERVQDAPGTAVTATMEGSRPLLAEVQALVGRPLPQTPARTCVGVSRPRVLMLAAVLEKAGLALHDRDLFVNAAGGLHVTEPAADLATAAAIASSLTDTPVRQDTLLIGEVGLVGEVRSVSYPIPRLKEAERHGFRRIVAPSGCAADAPPGVEITVVRTIREALAALF